ncbi:MAG: hypothetical protein AAGN46_14350 [Acidobacteriota bacterium]
MAALPLPRHSRFLRLLKISLVTGALYDFAFAALMIAAPDLPTRLLELPLPGATFYLWIMAIFLTMLGALYLFAAYDPRSYGGVIRVAIVGRSAGAIAFAAAAAGDNSLWGLYPLAAADALFALAHAVFWWPTRR